MQIDISYNIIIALHIAFSYNTRYYLLISLFSYKIRKLFKSFFKKKFRK